MTRGAPKLTTTVPWALDLDQPGTATPDVGCIGVCRNLSPERTLHVAASQRIAHVVQREGHRFDEALASAEALVSAPDQLRDYPLCSILSPGRVDAEAERSFILADVQFSSSLHKPSAMATVVGAAASRFPQSVTEDVQMVADEIFTNAIYNAPVVDLATGRNPGVRRNSSTEVKYHDGRTGRLVLAADRNRLVIGGVDPFGNLNLPRFLEYLKQTYVRGAAASMNFGSGGAGLGSYMIFNAAAALYLGTWPRQATAVYCVIPLGFSQRKRAELPKHLHWIQR